MSRPGPLALALVLSLAACGEGAFVPDGPLAELPVEPAEIVPAAAIVERADVPTVDPSRLEDADIAKALGGPASCVFRYTPDGAPVVAFAAADRAVMKINGDLVVLDVAAASAAIAAASGPIALGLAIGGEGGWGVPETVREADLRFTVADQLDVAYSGYTDCAV